MPDVHIRIEFDADSSGDRSKAFRELWERDPDFLWPTAPWWHKPPNNPRGVLARCLTKHGCKGRLSVEPHVSGTPSDQPPPPRWTGFSPRSK